MPTAEIIAIGTELLLGETTDTNTRYVARVLRSLGIDLFRAQTIGDNASRISETVRQALDRSDIVITTGGLGPTVDDPTRKAIADSMGLPLEFHPELWEQITARIARYGRTPTENQKRQAFVPKNAIIIENPVGTAPAFIVNAASFQKAESRTGKQKKIIISLPGVPREMETLMTIAVVPFLQKHYDLHAVLKIRTLHVSGLGEGMIDDQIGDLESLANPTVGLAAHSGVVDIRIAAKAETDSEATHMISLVEKDLYQRLGNNIFGVDGSTLESCMLDAISQRGWSLSCYEINLEGILLKRFSQAAHPAFVGGENTKDVSKDLAAGNQSTQEKYKSSAGLGISYSQKDNKQDVHIVLTTPVGASDHHLTYGGHPGNGRRWAVNMAMDLMRRKAQETD